MAEVYKGATVHERLLQAAKDNAPSKLEEITDEEGFDVNVKDRSTGNTALHYAVQNLAADVFELLLEIDGCDVDPQNNGNANTISPTFKETPLHFAVRLEDPRARHYFVGNLLEAGADTTIRNSFGQRAYDLIPADDEECRKMIRQAEAEAAQAGDVASDSDEGDPNDVASD
ncbi:hypothetical protein M408DRAFT_326922 [Serendipita vermifera MAFF 305830]|uniref:Uncharacterized protein n=1 Tax=Serendipita vermifera MAFF 305830 TaxID=933852 RepID=A0A0C3BLH2_SERVB|nr:hypothetical protein M408DRAFT_326922 [Serendipita vermifera MAFF 305830]